MQLAADSCARFGLRGLVFPYCFRLKAISGDVYMPRAKKKKPEVEAASRGLDARRLNSTVAPASVQALARSIEDDGGSALASYRDPLGGHWQILASLPIDRVEPTQFQRDLSETHVEKLSVAIDKLDRFLDPGGEAD